MVRTVMDAAQDHLPTLHKIWEEVPGSSGQPLSQSSAAYFVLGGRTYMTQAVWDRLTARARGRPRRQSPAGWPSTLEIGMSNPPGGASTMKDTAPFGFRYQYLSGGVNTGGGWANCWRQGRRTSASCHSGSCGAGNPNVRRSSLTA